MDKKKQEQILSGDMQFLNDKITFDSYTFYANYISSQVDRIIRLPLEYNKYTYFFKEKCTFPYKMAMAFASTSCHIQNVEMKSLPTLSIQRNILTHNIIIESDRTFRCKLIKSAQNLHWRSLWAKAHFCLLNSYNGFNMKTNDGKLRVNVDVVLDFSFLILFKYGWNEEQNSFYFCSLKRFWLLLQKITNIENIHIGLMHLITSHHIACRAQSTSYYIRLNYQCSHIGTCPHSFPSYHVQTRLLYNIKLKSVPIFISTILQWMAIRSAN